MTLGYPHLVWKWPYLTAIIEHGYGGSGVNVPIQNPRLFQKSASKRVKNLHFEVPMSYLCRSNSAWGSRKSGRREWKTRILIYINPKSTSLYYIECSQEHSKNIARCLFSNWKGFGLPGTHKTTLQCWVNAPKSHLPWIDLPSATKTPCVTFNPVLLWQKISTKEGVQRSPTVATTA